MEDRPTQKQIQAGDIELQYTHLNQGGIGPVGRVSVCVKREKE